MKRTLAALTLAAALPALALAQTPPAPAPAAKPVRASDVYRALAYTRGVGQDEFGEQIVIPLTLGGVVVLSGCDATQRCAALSFTRGLGPGTAEDVARYNEAGKARGYSSVMVLDPARGANPPMMRVQVSYALNEALLPKLLDLPVVFSRESDGYARMVTSKAPAP